MNNIIGQKNQFLGQLGQRIKQGEIFGQKLGRTIDVGGRKISNTARTVGNLINLSTPFVAGTPMQGLATIARDVAKTVELGANEARIGGRDLEKMSKRGLLQSIDDQSKRFI